MFSYEFCEISKNTFFTKHTWATASEESLKKKENDDISVSIKTEGISGKLTIHNSLIPLVEDWGLVNTNRGPGVNGHVFFIAHILTCINYEKLHFFYNFPSAREEFAICFNFLLDVQCTTFCIENRSVKTVILPFAYC